MITCHKCGTQNEGGLFCSNCSELLKQTSAVSTSLSSSPSPQAPPPPQQNYPPPAPPQDYQQTYQQQGYQPPPAPPQDYQQQQYQQQSQPPAPPQDYQQQYQQPPQVQQPPPQDYQQQQYQQPPQATQQPYPQPAYQPPPQQHQQPYQPQATGTGPADMENIFKDLVRTSWKKFLQFEINARLDDFLVGLVIASNVRSGYSLIDLGSDGVYHKLRFENLSDQSRLIFRLNNMTEDLMKAKVLGHMARVNVGYGERVKDIGKIWNALKMEVKSGFLVAEDEPGIVTMDANISEGYIYVMVPLIMDLDKYLDPVQEYKANLDLLQLHISATIYSLRKYLRGRIM